MGEERKRTTLRSLVGEPDFENWAVLELDVKGVLRVPDVRDLVLRIQGE